MHEPGSPVGDTTHDAASELHALDATFQPGAAPPIAPTNPGYQFPARLWGTMLGSYAVFFIAIFAATGGSGHARFAIVVAVLYTLMFFGLARIGARLPGPERVSPLDKGEGLSTWTGRMAAGSVFSQVLVVPITLALFGIAIAAIIGLES